MAAMSVPKGEPTIMFCRCVGVSLYVDYAMKTRFEFIEAMATCVRLATPSLRIMQRRCTLTVATDKPS